MKIIDRKLNLAVVTLIYLHQRHTSWHPFNLRNFTIVVILEANALTAITIYTYNL